MSGLRCAKPNSALEITTVTQRRRREQSAEDDASEDELFDRARQNGRKQDRHRQSGMPVARCWEAGVADGGQVDVQPLQRKRQQQLQATIAELRAGARIVTTGGIVATVTAVKDKTLIVRTADKSMLEITRAAVAGLYEGGEGAS
jgi:preprotein translocase YajC subunit